MLLIVELTTEISILTLLEAKSPRLEILTGPISSKASAWLTEGHLPLCPHMALPLCAQPPASSSCSCEDINPFRSGPHPCDFM